MSTNPRVVTAARRLGLFAVFWTGLMVPWLSRHSVTVIVPRTYKVVARLPSPDAMEDAVILEVHSPLAAHSQYEVRLVRRGLVAGPAPPLFTATRTSGLQLRWVRRNLLAIEYRRALITQFTDHWQPCRACGGAIEIHLAPVSADFSYLTRMSLRQTTVVHVPQ